MHGLRSRSLAFALTLISLNSYANISSQKIILNNTSIQIHTKTLRELDVSVGSFLFGAADYFTGLDSTFANNGDMRVVSAHRFIRLAARLSVFALYCDPDNKHKLSLSVSRFRAKTSAIEKASEASLGGTVPAYNEFEDARNEESLTFASFDDVEPFCAENLARFKTNTNINATTLAHDLRTATFGTR